MSGPFLNETTVANPPDNRLPLTKSPYMTAAAEAVKNYMRNPARTWYKDGVDPDDQAGQYAFQRLRKTWFTPEVDPKFKLRREDKFYAIGRVLRAGLKVPWQGTRWPLKAQRRNFPSFSPPIKKIGTRVHQ